MIPILEQSRLHPEDKTATVVLLKNFVAEGRADIYEDWQIAGVIQRLVRSPVISWGDLQVMALQIEKTSWSNDEQSEALKDISRVMRGAELDTITQFEMANLFEPVSEKANNEWGYELNERPTEDSLKLFAKRARELADLNKVPDEEFQVKLQTLVQRQIASGIQSGMK